jgi:hypothetical protein
MAKASKELTMRHKLIALALAGAMAVPSLAMADPWQGDRNSGWDPADHYHGGGHYHARRLGRDDRVYRGHDGRYYCRRSDGTTGLVIGAIGGAALGGAIGGDALGALVGAGAGGLLGHSIDRGRVSCR